MKQAMKKTGILLIVVFLLQIVSYAAKPFEGVITFTISYPDNKFTESQMKMFPKILTVSIKGTKSRTDLNTGMGNQVSINDYSDKTVINLIDMMGQKYAIKKSSQDIEKEIAKEPAAKVEVTNETKAIAGYTCKKAVVTTDQDGEKTTYEVWFTTEIGGKGANFDNPLYKDIDGVLMEFSMKTPQFAMKFTASSVDKKSVDNKDFEIPADYKLTTEEELKSKFGGGE
jgi:GLPGLI family protein